MKQPAPVIASSPCKTPVLFLIFNRIDETELVFEQIKKAKPTRFFIAADGPRATREGEEEICRLTRSIVTDGIDWDCEVFTLFRTENAGCGVAVSEAISWFFSHVEEGIILEDDCFPGESFFPFCAELLAKYRDDQRVMSISGTNVLSGDWKGDRHSYFWGPGGIWGWATWRRAWKLYDRQMSSWPDMEIQDRVKDAIGTADLFNYYQPMLNAAFNGSLDTWDVQWMYTVLINGGLFVNPSVNLVKNIGIAGNATHTHFSPGSYLERLANNDISFPLVHPDHMVKDEDYLEVFYETIKEKSAPKIIIFKKIVQHLIRKVSL